ncbi:hypothetical protein [Streptomyces cacaoi]|uniref:Glycolipid-binding domain-containing protein n=1 Tax=Streptomyces cacaoi TaxID=1898 RepID=A0A4Y3R2C0_STRCI|nr:hypothetical protein [Streptomyces cacaoi]NNG89024.1 hypothetical protein [Streptomyces cacaoi]GEB51876.1 hypothetical protein SCA03_44270 [Streptomyces cacaoi]
MPRGTYSLYDPADRTPLGTERFHCAPGPHGWRYVSRLTGPTGEEHGSLDLTLDALARPLRLELRTRAWQIRGGVLDGVTWVRSAATDAQDAPARDRGRGLHDAQEGNATAHGFTGASPAFLIACAYLARPARGDPGTRLRLVAFTPPALAPRTVDRSWALTGTETHHTDTGPLTVDAYRVTDLETAEQHTVHLAGDVVLSAPGVELEDLDSPPSAFPTPPAH